jgi:parallel beta-helix repeat protein
MLNDASRVSSPATAAPTAAGALSTRLSRSLLAGLAIAALAGALPSAVRADSVPTSCDKVASPAGSDSASGSASAPLRTAQALTDALAPGQVGCLRAGTYGGGLRLNHGGNASASLILRSYPGEQALLTGRIYVPRGSDYVTLADLRLDGNFQTGRPLPSPSVAANHTTFESDDVTNDHTEICFDIGSAGYGIADSTVLANNRIHDCGLLPSRNEDHGVYIQDATNTRVVGNLIDHNADRGVQFYPSAQGTVVVNNVISNNGVGIDFGGDDGVASSNNTVEHNLIVNSNIRADVESWYPAGNPLGVANVVQNNCISTRGINTRDGGFTAHSNVTASSGELVPTEDGGTLPAAGSACANMVPELARGLGVAGTRSGGAPTPTGKEAGAGITPVPGQGSTGAGPGAPAGAVAHKTPARGGTPAHARKASHRRARAGRSRRHKRSHARHGARGTHRPAQAS